MSLRQQFHFRDLRGPFWPAPTVATRLPRKWGAAVLLWLMVVSGCPGCRAAGDFTLVEISPISAQGQPGTIEIRGVAAGLFEPTIWREDHLHLLPDFRSPIIEPSWVGEFRNIYAPSVVETETGWRVFYGAWDGVHTPNDRIYSQETHDFLEFTNRQRVIDHGPFVHVCNVSAIPFERTGFQLACTAYPVGDNLNKPVLFQSPDGSTWNKADSDPYIASASDLIRVEGYEGFEAADINGMNCLLRDETGLHLYFNDFKNFGKVFRATQDEAGRFKFEGVVLEAPYMVNDVKRLQTSEGPVYLMTLHHNREDLVFSLSQDGRNFSVVQPLAKTLGDSDKFIVAVGLVNRGNRILGLLYGAGAVPSLDRNRIFARWLQKKVVFVAQDGTRHEPVLAEGPDRQWIRLTEGTPLEGQFEVYSEDGITRLGDPIPFKGRGGNTFQLTLHSPDSEFQPLVDKSLTKWEGLDGGPPAGWHAEGEKLVFEGKGSYLQFKDRSLGDFILRFDYRLPPAGNSGVYFRFPPTGVRSEEGFEIQLLDHFHEQYKEIKPWQFTGSLYALAPPSSREIHPAGEWNAMEIYCRDARVRVTLNGNVILETCVDDLPKAKNRPRRGRLALQNHGSTLEFRNLRMNRLE